MRFYGRFCIAAIWTAGVLVGVWSMFAYELTPAVLKRPSEHWPDQTSLQMDSKRFTLVMFVHPHCPCTRASIDELAELVATTSGRIRPIIVFLKPSEFDKAWERTDLWREAQNIRDAILVCDDGGTETARFNAMASGETRLYDTGGRLLFQGGITPSRGHRGDSVGRSTLEKILAGLPVSSSRTPVFGCALRDRD
jgi:hypothetical protein